MPVLTQLQVFASQIREGDILRLVDQGNDEGLVTAVAAGSKFRNVTVRGRGTPVRYKPTDEVPILRQVATAEETEALKTSLALRDLMALVDRALSTKAAALAKIEEDPIYAMTWNADGLVTDTELGRLAVDVFDLCDRTQVTLLEAISLVKEDCMKRILAAATGGSRSSSSATNLVEDCQVKAWAYFVERDYETSAPTGLEVGLDTPGAVRLVSTLKAAPRNAADLAGALAQADSALSVLTLSPPIRAWLEANDRSALAQAESALEALDAARAVPEEVASDAR